MPSPTATIYVQRCNYWGTPSGQWEYLGQAMDLPAWMVPPNGATREQGVIAWIDQETDKTRGYNTGYFYVVYTHPEKSTPLGCYGPGLTPKRPYMLTWTNNGWVQGLA